jgi:spore coat protein U-like protein
MKRFILFAVCAFTWTAYSFGQSSTTPTPERLYFEYPSLDFTKYAELHEAVKADGNFIIETVCIPAKVMCVKLSNGNTDASTAEAFKQLAALVGLSAIEWAQGQQQNAFDNRCLQARTGN